MNLACGQPRRPAGRAASATAGRRSDRPESHSLVVTAGRRVLLHERLMMELESARRPTAQCPSGQADHLVEAFAIAVELKADAGSETERYNQLYGAVLQTQSNREAYAIDQTIKLARSFMCQDRGTP